MKNKLKLLVLPKEEDIIENRIWALHDLMLTSENDYVPVVLEMLLEFIGEDYEGYCIEQCLYRINEGKWWWKEGSGELDID